MLQNNNRDTVVGLLLPLVVARLGCGVHDLPFESVNALDARPLEVVHDACRGKQEVALLVEQLLFARSSLLSQSNFPLASAILPYGTHNLAVGGHVLAKAEYFHDFEHVFLDVGCVRKEATPILVKSKVECVGVGGYVASASCMLSTRERIDAEESMRTTKEV